MGDYECVSNAVESGTAIDIRLEKLVISTAAEIEPLNPLTYKEKVGRRSLPPSRPPARHKR